MRFINNIWFVINIPKTWILLWILKKHIYTGGFNQASNKWMQRVQARQPCFTFIVLQFHNSDHFGVPVNLIFWTCRLGSLLAISLCGIHVHFFVIVSLSFPVVVFLSLMQMSSSRQLPVFDSGMWWRWAGSPHGSRRRKQNCVNG